MRSTEKISESTEDHTELQDEAIMPEQVLWKEESINAIQTLFVKAIAAENITMSCIRQKYRATTHTCS